MCQNTVTCAKFINELCIIASSQMFVTQKKCLYILVDEIDLGMLSEHERIKYTNKTESLKMNGKL